MGDSGEGLVDAESRIQERIEELQLAREQSKRPRIGNRCARLARRRLGEIRRFRARAAASLEGTRGVR